MRLQGVVVFPFVITSRHGVLLHIQYLALSTVRTIDTCFRTGLLSAFLFCSKVWIGQVGSSGVQRLKSSAVPRKLSPDLYDKRDSSTLSIFFDSGGGLQQVSDIEMSVTGSLEIFYRGENSELVIISHLLSGGAKRHVVEKIYLYWTTPVNDLLIVASLRSREFKKY